MAVKQLTINQLSEPDKEKLFKIIQECSNSMIRIDGEKDYIREAIAETAKNMQLPKKLVARLIKVYHKQNYDEEVAVHEQFETLYETVVK
jgi:replicative DNA helicase